MGSSILQSGASLGAIATPLIIQSLVGDENTPDGWRLPFLVVGAVGIIWVVAWLASVGPHDLRRREAPRPIQQSRFAWLEEVLTDRRFWALCMTTISINVCWHSLRVWLPKFLQQDRGYTEAQALYFNSGFYVAADVGCILTGAVTLYLARRGMNIHSARVLLLAICSATTTLTIFIPQVPQGWLLLSLLLVVAAGSLGLFPCYYAQIQEFSTGRVGKVTGLLSFTTWIFHSTVQKYIGRIADQIGSLEIPLAVVGCVPMLSVLAMTWVWRERPE